VFWSGWEGAVMRAKLFQSADPLNQYWEFFLYSITKITPAQDGPAPKTTVRRGKLSHESFSSGTD
jgi:TetR/AcrR family transcriptional repressor of nem operon